MRATVVCAVVCVGIYALTGAARAQQLRPRAKLMLLPSSVSIQYGAPGKGVATIFPDEPIYFTLGVRNRDKDVAAVERDWPMHIKATIHPGIRYERKGPERALPLLCDGNARSFGVEARAAYLELSRGGGSELTCRALPDVFEFTPGVYTITVDWTRDPSLLPLPDHLAQYQGVTSPLGDAAEIEMRDSTAAADALDRLLHLGWRAYEERAFEKAADFAADTLAIEPHSESAYALRVLVKASTGRCTESKQDFAQLQSIARSKLDTRFKTSRAPDVDEREVDVERQLQELTRRPEMRSCI